MIEAIDRCALGALAVLAFSLGQSCSGEAEPDSSRTGRAASAAPTRFDLLPALRYRVATAGAAHAGDVRDRKLFDDEWYSPVKSGSAPHSWMRGKRGSLELLVQEPELATTLELELKPEGSLKEQALEVLLNGESLGVHRLVKGWSRLVLPVPDGLATTGSNLVELLAEHELDEVETTGFRLAVAVGEVRLAERAKPTSNTPSGLRESNSIGAGNTLALVANQLTRLPVFAHPGGQLALEASSTGAAELRVCARARGGGPVLFERVLKLHDETVRFHFDLEEAAGNRLVLEIGVLGGSAPVLLGAVDQVVPDSFSDLIFVVVDTLRADRILDPEDRIATPRIDRFAAKGLHFTRAHSHANLTLPSHTSMFSSRLPSETRVPLNAARVRGDLPLLSEWMEELGYRTTATISMSTLRPVVPEQGLDRGFAKFDDDLMASMDGYWANERLAPDLAALAASPAPFYLFVHYSDPHAPFRAHGSVDVEASISIRGELLETVPTPEVINWQRSVSLPPGESEIEIASDYEFSMRYMSCRGPDGELTIRYEESEPLVASKRLRAVVENPGTQPIEGKFEIWLVDVPDPSEQHRRYDLEVEHVDGVVGALFDEFERLGCYDDAMIIFTSDHGQGLGAHGQDGHGRMLYNDQVHVPLAIKLPMSYAATNALRDNRDQLVRHMDLVPTALDVLGLPALPGQRGVSLLEDAKRLSISESHFSKRLGDMYALRDGRYVLMYGAKADLFALFDFAEDPGELNDLFDERGHEFEEWQRLLRELSSGALKDLDSRKELDADAQNLLRGLGYTEGGE